LRLTFSAQQSACKRGVIFTVGQFTCHQLCPKKSPGKWADRDMENILRWSFMRFRSPNIWI
jgi:hypothetical protein